MRLLLSLFAFLFALGIVAGAAGIFWGWKAYSGPGPLPEAKQVMILRGQGVAAISMHLQGEDVIGNRLVFLAAARLSGKDKQLKAGEYDFPKHVPMTEVLNKLAKGDVLARQVTVPEGLTSWQVVQIVNKAEALTGDITDIPAEGTLLPQTYGYTRGDTRQSVIDRMRDGMDKTLNDLWEKRDQSIPLLSKQEALILASIVEKETGVASERKRVAGVFINRLQKGIPLQSDPTVIYALTKGRIEDKGQGPLGRRLLVKDLETASPYNTYKNPGLPPGPIANPGADAVEAVLQPEHNDYIYFVADGSGGHVFAATLEEHNRNVAQWRAIRARNAAQR